MIITNASDIVAGNAYAIQWVTGDRANITITKKDNPEQILWLSITRIYDYAHTLTMRTGNIINVKGWSADAEFDARDNEDYTYDASIPLYFFRFTMATPDGEYMTLFVHDDEAALTALRTRMLTEPVVEEPETPTENPDALEEVSSDE